MSAQYLTAVFQYQEPDGYTGYILEIPGIRTAPHQGLPLTQHELEQRTKAYFAQQPGAPAFYLSSLVLFGSRAR
jgi:hypothetical protein